MKQIVDAVVARAMIESASNAARLRFGLVTAVTDGFVSVDLGGLTIDNVATPNDVLASVGQQAWMIQQGTILVLMGVSDSSVQGKKAKTPKKKATKAVKSEKTMTRAEWKALEDTDSDTIYTITD